MSIEMVCFDWGGVLLRHWRSWEEGCRAAGLGTRGASATAEWSARRKPLAHAYQTGRVSCDEFFSKLHEAVEGLYSIEELQRIHDAWLIDEYEGVGEVVGRVAREGRVATGMLSNTNASHWRRQFPEKGKPADFPTPALLTHRHASHLLGHAKPGVEIYEAFERATGFRGPSILFFDDLQENIEAAARLGWRGVLVDHERETAPQIERALREHGVLND
ncbi:MAG: HAD-IA family hydrolase [Phycisphaerales bacterium]|nr:MAG: HAD-IA family hydrolase [Phycisphaerales bacterium]